MIQHSRFNQLIALILQGNRTWEWAPILLARVSLGLFFAISGANKLFNMEHQEALLKTVADAGLPFPEFTAVFVASVEFFGGSLLTIGLLSTFCAIALMIAMIVAILTVEIYTIPKGLSFLDWLDYFLYLPQAMYVVLFIWLVVSGPGRVSVDCLLARSLGFVRSGDDHEVQRSSPG